MPDSVKLAIADAEDLLTLSALLQDATVLVGDMAHDPDRREFLMVAARFIGGGGGRARNAPASRNKHGESRRRLMGVNFSGITRVTRRGFSLAGKEDVLALLAIRPLKGGMEIVFSGEATIRLETPAIKVYAADLDEGWQTAFTPAHKA